LIKFNRVFLLNRLWSQRSTVETSTASDTSNDRRKGAGGAISGGSESTVAVEGDYAAIAAAMMDVIAPVDAASAVPPVSAVPVPDVVVDRADVSSSATEEATESEASSYVDPSDDEIAEDDVYADDPYADDLFEDDAVNASASDVGYAGGACPYFCVFASYLRS
jgi:hypothetical protein